MPSAFALFMHPTTIERQLCAQDPAGDPAMTGMRECLQSAGAHIMGSCSGQGSGRCGCISRHEKEVSRPRSRAECLRLC